MTLAGAALVGGATALAVSAALSGVVAWAGPVDRPRDRGAHTRPTPTSGGLGIIAGTALGLLAFAVLAPAPLAELGKIAAALGFAALLGLIGALDDLFDLGARLKLALQIALSLIFAIAVAHIDAIALTRDFTLPIGPIVGVLGTALWLVVVTNAVNFMDGANGLASGAVVLTLAAFAAAALLGGDSALAAAALTAAMAGIGFMPWNFPKARLFQGDAGAVFSSFLLAALAVIGAGGGGHGPVYLQFAPLALMPFLADVLLTLLGRAREGKRLLDAHREHLYQRWLAHTGGSHLALAVRAYGVVGLYALAALGLLFAGPVLQIAGFFIGVAVAGAAWFRFRRCYV